MAKLTNVRKLRATQHVRVQFIVRVTVDLETSDPERRFVAIAAPYVVPDDPEYGSTAPEAARRAQARAFRQLADQVAGGASFPPYQEVVYGYTDDRWSNKE